MKWCQNLGTFFVWGHFYVRKDVGAFGHPNLHICYQNVWFQPQAILLDRQEVMWLRNLHRPIPRHPVVVDTLEGLARLMQILVRTIAIEKFCGKWEESVDVCLLLCQFGTPGGTAVRLIPNAVAEGHRPQGLSPLFFKNRKKLYCDAMLMHLLTGILSCNRT